MSLSQRLAAVRRESPGWEANPHGAGGLPSAIPSPPASESGPPISTSDPGVRPTQPSTPPSWARLEQVRDQVRSHLVLTLGSDLSDDHLDDADLRARAATVVAGAIQACGSDLPPPMQNELAQEVLDDALGLGPLEPLLADPGIGEIMVNGAGTVYVERAGVVVRSQARFADEVHLRRTIDRIVARVGRRVDEASPMVDARLSDGSRVNVVVPPVAIDGTTLTVRKFSRDALNMEDLIGRGTLTRDAAGLLAMCVRGRLNILVSGGTGSGKTTLLAALSSFISEAERVITIEDAAELQLDHQHLVRLESRPAAVSGRGEICIRDLLRNALRMRPDRIIVGEVRDGAAMDMLQAMNTGHDGSLGTVHASSVRDALRRIETMVLISGLDIPVRAVRDQIGYGIDVVVHLRREASGERRVVDIAEIVGMEGEVVTSQSLFTCDGDSPETLTPTGFEPAFWPRIAHLAGQFLPISEAS